MMNENAEGPDRSTPLHTVLLYSFANAGTNMVSAFSNFALPLYLGTYSLPAIQIGSVLIGPNILIGFLAQERSFVGGFVQPVVGAISDRTRTAIGRRKPFFLVGVPLTGGALLLLASHPSLWMVLAIVPVFAFFVAVANDPYLAMLPDMFPSHERAKVGGFMGLFAMIGAVATLAAAFLLWERHEPWVFAAVAVGLCFFFAVTFFGVEEPANPPSSTEPVRIRPILYVRTIFHYKELTKYVVALTFYWLGLGGITPFITRFGTQALGMDESTAFLMAFLAVVSTGVFVVPAGYLGGYIGKKKTLGAGLVIYCVVVLVGSQVQTTAEAATVMLVVGLANAVTTALAFPLLADLMPPERAGEFTGLGSLLWSLAQPLGSTLAGLTVDLTGTYRSVFVVAGVLVAVSALLLQTVRAPEPRRVRAPTSARPGGD